MKLSDDNAPSITSPDRSCLMRPWLLPGSTGRKSLNQEISGSGMPLAAHSMVAVLVRSTTFSWGPMSILGKPNGNRSSGRMKRKKIFRIERSRQHSTHNKQSKHKVQLSLYEYYNFFKKILLLLLLHFVPRETWTQKHKWDSNLHNQIKKVISFMKCGIHILNL